MASILRRTPSLIEALPNELLDDVLNYLIPEPPHPQLFHEIPGREDLSVTTDYLKCFSSASSRLREISRAYLFTHLRLKLQDQDSFLEFLEKYSLKHIVKSVVLNIDSTDSASETVACWKRILDLVNPEDLIIVATPNQLADLAGCTLEDTQAWAFDIPLQIIQFRQPSPRISDPDFSPGSSIFNARPWSQIRFNEGTSLAAYSNYEYYLLRVPSFMDHWGSVDPLQNIPKFPFPVEAIHRLTSFHYTAIFPFYNHTNTVLRFIRNMVNLRYISFRLAPQPHSTVLSEEQIRGTINPSDPWMELETSYSLISHSVKYLGTQAKLQAFQTFDLQIEDMTELLFNSLYIVLKKKWKYQGKGMWIKLPGEEQ